MDAQKEPRLEAWLRYAEDLNLGPFYRERATRVREGCDEDSTRAEGVREETGDGMRRTQDAAAAVVAKAPAVGVQSARKPAAALFAPTAPAVNLFEERIENDSLEKIKADIGPNCTRCKLHKARTQIVFGVGNPKAELMFVGEGPGHDEDVQGEPFVGRAGKLLTQMIEAMGLKRSDVYIANVVKCRPPENRLPEKDEIATCSPYLLRQIMTIKPKVVVCLGACSAQTLLQTTQGISKFRGEWFDFHGAKLMATYHPAYLLRNPPAKADVWKDLQKVMALLGLEVKKPKK
jgi:uracil-DNA glycosylase family 4